MSPICDIPPLLAPHPLASSMKTILSWKREKDLALSLGFCHTQNTNSVQLRGLRTQSPEELINVCRVTPFRPDFCISSAGGLCRANGFQNEFSDYGFSGPCKRFRADTAFHMIPERSGFDSALVNQILCTPRVPFARQICLGFSANWFSADRHLVFNMKFLHSPWHVNNTGLDRQDS